jgi:small-conductance mechanosensitive channel
MSNDPNLQAAIEQLIKLWIYLQRPVLYRQIIVLLVVALLAWVMASLLWRWVGQRLVQRVGRRLDEPWNRYWRRIAIIVEYATFPILGFVTIQLILPALLAQGWRIELLNDLRFIFVLILAYRLFSALLTITLGESYMCRYRTRLLGPLFGIFLLERILNQLVDTTILADLRLWQLLGTPFTLGALIFIGLFLYFLFYLSRAIQDLLQQIILPRTETDPNVVQAGLTIGRYLIIGLAILIISQTLDLDLTTLAFISGGLSVGIGFGLQEIVANFISGILLLFEQSLRPGDVVTVEGEMGEVKNLSIRATTVSTFDNVELVVPNQRFLTSTVRTYTKSNRLIRVLVSVGVSYESDPKEVREVLLAVARRHNLVQAEPEPAVHFMDFGDSSLDFRLAVWVDDPMLMLGVASDLRFMIMKALGERKIEIPFPQRDLHLRSGVPWENFNGRLAMEVGSGVGNMTTNGED